MAVRNHFIVFVLMISCCQSCVLGSSSNGELRARAKLVDLGNGICQQSNGLMWQAGKSEIFSQGQDARDYAKSLDLGNYNDWRLPTKEELYELCYIFEMKMVGNCPMKLKGSYWSRNCKLQAGAWEAYPLCGGSDFHYLTSRTGRVRAVRP